MSAKPVVTPEEVAAACEAVGLELVEHEPGRRDCIPDGGWYPNVTAKELHAFANHIAQARASQPKAPAPVLVAQGEASNPTNLPASLGETVHEALVAALQVFNYRADGDNTALARRVHLMTLENRDLINMMKAVANKRTLTPPGGAGGNVQGPTDAEGGAA